MHGRRVCSVAGCGQGDLMLVNRRSVCFTVCCYSFCFRSAVSQWPLRQREGQRKGCERQCPEPSLAAPPLRSCDGELRKKQAASDRYCAGARARTHTHTHTHTRTVALTLSAFRALRAWRSMSCGSISGRRPAEMRGPIMQCTFRAGRKLRATHCGHSGVHVSREHRQ